jgi:hypothetical protein
MNNDELINRIEGLKKITLREAKRYCEKDTLDSWVNGYMTAVDDILEIINQINLNQKDESAPNIGPNHETVATEVKFYFPPPKIISEYYEIHKRIGEYSDRDLQGEIDNVRI